MDKAEIYARANILMHEGRYQNLGCESDLEWELGAEVVEAITSDMIVTNTTMMMAYADKSQMTMMGYPVRINYEQRDIIKLWREVRA